MPVLVSGFRFGVSVPGASSRREWRDKAKRAEAAGYDVLVTADHLVEGVLPPLAPLVTAAEATDRLRVGTLVVNNDFRHPAVLAREAATIDMLTEGRFELGLGAGHMKREYDAIGLPFDPAAVRVARMAEAAQIVRRLLDGGAGGTVNFEGDHYRIAEHSCFPRPAQAHIPMLIGGNGRALLATAARVADIVGFTGFSQVEGEAGVNPNNFTDAGLAAQIERVRSSAGERFPKVELNTLVQGVVLTNDRRHAAVQLQPLLPTLTVDDVLCSPYSLIGTAQQIADQLRERRERLGITYITVFEKDFGNMAEVIELLKA